MLEEAIGKFQELARATNQTIDDAILSFMGGHVDDRYNRIRRETVVNTFMYYLNQIQNQEIGLKAQNVEARQDFSNGDSVQYDNSDYPIRLLGGIDYTPMDSRPPRPKQITLFP